MGFYVLLYQMSPKRTASVEGSQKISAGLALGVYILFGTLHIVWDTVGTVFGGGS